jgi:hypothetical protein
MKDLLFLGAGASQEAGIPTAYAMCKDMIADIEKESQHKAEILYYISAGLIFGKSKSGFNPFDPHVNIEELFNAVQLLADREKLEISPFVSSWDPQVESFDTPSTNYNSLDKAVGKILEKRARAAFRKTPMGTHKSRINQLLEGRQYGSRKLGDLIVDLLKSYSDSWANEFSRSYGTGSEVTRQFDSRIKQLSKGGGGRVYRSINKTMIRSLKSLVFSGKSSTIEYLSPILNILDTEENLTICSLNYDNTIELLCASQNIKYNTGVNNWSDQAKITLSKKGVNLLKLHGSVNWVRNEEKNSKDKLLSPDKLTILDETEVLKDKRDPYLIFGGKNKLTTDGPFLDLLFTFREELDRSENLVIVGYSFQDDHMNNIIKKWVLSSPSHKIVIINGPDGFQNRSEFELQLKQIATSNPEQVRVLLEYAGSGLRTLYGQYEGDFSYEIHQLDNSTDDKPVSKL